MFDPIQSDAQTIDLNYPPDIQLFAVPSGDDQLVGRLWLTQGRGPHPTILLLHGLPGVELNFDLAHTLCRAGWNVGIVHYRGAWGSTGSYSFAHVLEDAATALSFLRTPAAQEKYRIDAGQFVLIGHSMGGFAALMTAAHTTGLAGVASIAGFNFGKLGQAIQDNPIAIRDTIDDWKGWMLPLRGTTAEGLVNEMLAHRDEWNLLQYVRKLSYCAVLLIGARRDVVGPIDLHHIPLLDELQKSGHPRLTHTVLDTDHGITDKRITLMQTVLAWLVTLGISPAKT